MNMVCRLAHFPTFETHRSSWVWDHCSNHRKKTSTTNQKWTFILVIKSTIGLLISRLPLEINHFMKMHVLWNVKCVCVQLQVSPLAPVCSGYLALEGTLFWLKQLQLKQQTSHINATSCDWHCFDSIVLQVISIILNGATILGWWWWQNNITWNRSALVCIFNGC